MAVEIAKIDKYGRVKIPEKLRHFFGLKPESVVRIEMTDKGIVIQPETITGSITKRIAEMNLPVADWEQMERESIEGRICE